VAGFLCLATVLLAKVDPRSSQPMNKTKRLGDRELPGNPLYWIFGSIIGVIGLLALTGAILANTPDTGDGYDGLRSRKLQ
jgi:hypothetical protein